jgi:hypothetical protein
MPARKTQIVPSSRGHVPTIVCVNNATVSLGVDFDSLIAALQKFLDQHFVPVWQTPAKLVKAKSPRRGKWTLMFMDDVDSAKHAGFLGLHHLEGKHPVAKVFVKAVLNQRERVSVAASHELAEMLVDPAINRWAVGPKGTLYAYEVCDAVEEDWFRVDRIPMSNFVYPAYFDLLFRKLKSARFDHMNKVHRPFEILWNGYASVRKGSKIIEKTGSKDKELKFKREDRTDHRSEYRKARHGQKPNHTFNVTSLPSRGARSSKRDGDSVSRSGRRTSA